MLDAAPSTKPDSEINQPKPGSDTKQTSESESEESDESTESSDVKKRPLREVPQDDLSVIPPAAIHESGVNLKTTESNEKKDKEDKQLDKPNEATRHDEIKPKESTRPARDAPQHIKDQPKAQTLPEVLSKDVVNDETNKPKDIVRPARDTSKDVKDTFQPHTLPASLPEHVSNDQNNKPTDVQRPARDTPQNTKDLPKPQTPPAILTEHLEKDEKKPTEVVRPVRDTPQNKNGQPKPQIYPAILPTQEKNDQTSKPQEIARPYRDTAQKKEDTSKSVTLLERKTNDEKDKPKENGRPARETSQNMDDAPKPQIPAAILTTQTKTEEKDKTESTNDKRIVRNSDVKIDDSAPFKPPAYEYSIAQDSVYRQASDFDKTPSTEENGTRSERENPSDDNEDDETKPKLTPGLVTSNQYPTPT